MKSTASLVDQLEELVDEVMALGDRLAQTAEDLRLAHSVHPQGVAALLANSRRELLDFSARLREMEQALCPAESSPAEASPDSLTSDDSLSLRPAAREADAPGSHAEGRLGRKWEEAEARLTGLTDLIERALRAESASDAAMNLGNLALQYHRQKRFEEAERLYTHALAFREKFFGPDHATVATGLNNLAILLRDQGRYDEAAELFHRSLAITERTWGPDHPKVARRLCNLASLALRQEQFAEAKSLFARILAIGERHRGPELQEVTASVRKYAEILESAGQTEESTRVTARLRALETNRASLIGDPAGEVEAF